MGNPRDLWRPKYPEREGGQCAGCPFGKDNDKQFGTILSHIRKKAGDDTPITKVDIAAARIQVQMERETMGGDFICHATAYGPGTELNDQSEFRQCPGASEYYRNLPVPSYQRKEDHGRRSGGEVPRRRRLRSGS
jgi:hypothetical protein